MIKFHILVVSLSLIVLSLGCDKKKEDTAPSAAGSAAKATSSAATAATGAKPTAAAANDPVVCCKFGGVKGSSTKKLCEDGKGTVVPDSECPTLKK